MKQILCSLLAVCGLALAGISLGQDDIDSVQDAMDLPGGFAQLEALYALAGRSDAMEIQAFVFEADELEDAIARRSALVVLFSSLVSADPKSAVALAQSPRFANDRRYESEVWTEWARLDMSAALRAAEKVTSTPDRNLVAQALFIANRHADVAVMQKITDELGIRPDRNSQSQFAVQLANRSRAEAFDFINGISSQSDQQYIAAAVGGYLGRRGAIDARSYADRLHVPETRMAYLTNVERSAGARDPRAAVDKALSNKAGTLRTFETVNAMKEYARVDARGAAAYLVKIDNPTLRAAVENQIVGIMALQDPGFAMDWAQRTDKNGRRGLYSVALAQTAVSDPKVAFSSAMAIENRDARQLAMQRVLSVIGQLEPKRAVDMLDLVRDQQDLQKAHSMVAQSWIKSDPDAAIDWLMGDPRLNDPTFCQQIAPILVEADINAARRLLNSLDGDAATILQAHIVRRLSEEFSPQETMEFVDEIEDDAQRETLRMTAIMSMSQSDPRAAARYVDMVQDGERRGQVVGAIASQWYSTYPDEAVQWVQNQPRGPEYDTAVSMMIMRFQRLDQAERSLIDAMSDADQRGGAYFSVIMSIARHDVTRARHLLNEIPLSSERQQQLNDYIQRLQESTEMRID